MSLVDKIRKARESTAPINGHTFTVRRPTDAEAATLGGATPLDLVCRFTVGWDLNEIDLVPGGSPDPVPFDAELFAEWVADEPDYWAPLSDAIVQAFKRHKEAQEGAEKN